MRRAYGGEVDGEAGKCLPGGRGRRRRRRNRHQRKRVGGCGCVNRRPFVTGPAPWLERLDCRCPRPRRSPACLSFASGYSSYWTISGWVIRGPHVTQQYSLEKNSPFMYRSIYPSQFQTPTPTNFDRQEVQLLCWSKTTRTDATPHLRHHHRSVPPFSRPRRSTIPTVSFDRPGSPLSPLASRPLSPSPIKLRVLL